MIEALPNKQPTLQTTTRPNDANQNGDIFGGWLMSQIDIAGAIEAKTVAKSAIATVAVKSLQFIKPLFVGDLVSFYTFVEKVGTTSITIRVEAYAYRQWDMETLPVKISEAVLVYVAIETPGNKKKIVK